MLEPLMTLRRPFSMDSPVRLDVDGVGDVATRKVDTEVLWAPHKVASMRIGLAILTSHCP
eukprot:4544818-Amphidinium_carterae.6